MFVPVFISIDIPTVNKNKNGSNQELVLIISINTITGIINNIIF